MNMRQRRMLAAVGIAICVVLLWPPVDVPVGPAETEIQFVWVLDGLNGSIHFLLLIAEILSLCLIGMISHRMLAEDRE